MSHLSDSLLIPGIQVLCSQCKHTSTPKLSRLFNTQEPSLYQKATSRHSCSSFSLRSLGLPTLRLLALDSFWRRFDLPGHYSVILTNNLVIEHRPVLQTLVPEKHGQPIDRIFDDAPNSSGSLVSRLTTDPNAIKSLTGPNLGVMTVVGVSILSTVILSLAVGWELGLVAIFGALPFTFFSGLVHEIWSSDSRKSSMKPSRAVLALQVSAYRQSRQSLHSTWSFGLRVASRCCSRIIVRRLIGMLSNL